MEPVRHVAVGHLNIDMYMVVDYIPGPDENAVAREAYVGPGGAAANYAVAASRLGSKAFLVAHTGRLAEQMGLLGHLRSEGVDTSYVVVHKDQMPGIVVVVVSAGGERTMITIRGANNLLRGDEARGLRTDVLHVASRGPETLERAASAVAAALISYDPGASNTRKRPREVLEAARSYADILVLNRAEYRHVAGTEDLAAARKLLGGRLSMVIVKQGGQGAVLVTNSGVLHVEAYRAGPVVDTTGAGDVFIAAFNTFYAEKRDEVVALQAASVAAGIKVGRRGAQSAPSREEVEEALRERPPRVRRLS
jgi:ribokinase